jgi:hypothetical protein
MGTVYVFGLGQGAWQSDDLRRFKWESWRVLKLKNIKRTAWNMSMLILLRQRFCGGLPFKD